MLKKGVVFLLMAFCTLGLSINPAPEQLATAPDHSAPGGQWIGAWSASQVAPHDEGISRGGFRNQTIRMTVRPAASGSHVRLRFSNVFGKQPVTFDQITIAATEKNARIAANSIRSLTFNEKKSVTIAPGQELFSDPVAFHAENGESITVSLFVSGSSGPATWHPVSSQTTYIASGNKSNAADFPLWAQTADSWFWLSGMDLWTSSEKQARVIVALGDSITDGYLSTPNQNRRWTDMLNKRLDAAFPNQTFSVLNQGISGNRLLSDSPVYGMKALGRLERDVFSQTGVTDVILLAGINDIGQAPHVGDAARITAGIKEIARQARAKGLRIYAGTLTPFRAYRPGVYFTEDGEQVRKTVNEWIRTNDVLDGYIDFERALQDPDNPEKMRPAYNSGDHLHPNDAGLKAMADAVDLSLFKQTVSQ